MRDVTNELCGWIVGMLIVSALLAIILIRKERRKKMVESSHIVSPKDYERYAGKYVLTDGFNGQVVLSGETFEKVFDEAAQLDRDIQRRLVCAYIPRTDEILIGGRYVRAK